MSAVWKRIAAVLICVLLLCGCLGERTPYTGDGWGNTAGNIEENGFIAKGEGGYYFYLDDEENCPGLYRRDKAGELTLLRRGYIYEINVVDDWVYFTNGSPGPICRISTDGKHFKVVNRNSCDKLYVNPSCMVYRNRCGLYIADSNGRSPHILAKNVLRYVVHNDTIVFVQYHTDQDGIYQIGLDGANLTRLSDIVPIGLTSNGRNIYYSVHEGHSSFGETGGKVYQIDESGETTQLPVSDLCWNMNATEDYIFYRNQTEGGDLYRMDLDGTNQTCLLETNCCDINVLDDFVLFRDAGLGLCTIKYDGSDLKPWTGKIGDCGQTKSDGNKNAPPG